MGYQSSLDSVVLILVRPLVYAHLAAAERDTARHTHRDRFAVAILVYRDGSLVSVLHGPDDILRTEHRVATKKYVGQRGLKGCLLHLWQVPLVELYADIALDPWKCILLSDGEDHIIAREEFLAEHACGGDFPIVQIVFEMLEYHALELTSLDHETLGRAIDHDLDGFLLGILELPV